MRHSLLLAGIALVACLGLIPQTKSGPRVDQGGRDQQATRVY